MMFFKKEKDLDQLKQALQDKTESYEKTKYSLERLTEEYMEGIIDWPIGKQQKQHMKKIESLEKDISKSKKRLMHLKDKNIARDYSSLAISILSSYSFSAFSISCFFT